MELSEEVTVEEPNETVRVAAAGPFSGIVEYTEAPVVSSDIIGDPHSRIFDAGATDVLGANLVKPWPGTTTSGDIPTGWSTSSNDWRS